jgi:hypothetical protein
VSGESFESGRLPARAGPDCTGNPSGVWKQDSRGEGLAHGRKEKSQTGPEDAKGRLRWRDRLVTSRGQPEVLRAKAAASVS